MRRLTSAAAILLLAACNAAPDQKAASPAPTASPTTAAADNLADTMASHDPASGQQQEGDMPDAEQRPMMQAQVVLDRQGFGPGVIDGAMGMSTQNALKGFQEANDLDVTGKLDQVTSLKLAQWNNIPATRVVTIPAAWGEIAYQKTPDGAAQQAQMQQLGYQSLDEKLAERFHTTIAVLDQLNPAGRPASMQNTGAAQGTAGASPAVTPTASGSAAPSASSAPSPSQSGSPAANASASPAAPMFKAGQQVRVPNIGADRIAPGAVSDQTWEQTLVSLGVSSEQPKVARIVVDKSEKWLKGYDADDKLVAMFTVSTGSSHDPLPLGTWGINGVSHNPHFAYDPDLFWDVSDKNSKQQLPPGPNGPVGVVWIDLSKPHYGIHGTSAPETIGRAQSHGCVRLTNWDAARLAGMVSGSTKVLFKA